MQLKYDHIIRETFPNLYVGLGVISDLGHFKKEVFEELRNSVYSKLKKQYTLENLKELHPLIKTYRDFFWALKIDPTKIRPAAEALIRRVLGDRPIPRINCVVDAYNLASIQTGIALAAFDSDLLTGDLIMRFAKKNEDFLGIGMKKSIKLQGNELIITDKNQIIAIYPYRDADNTKVTKDSKKIVLMICGVPGIDKEILNSAAEIAITFITQICGGKGTYQFYLQ